MTVVIDTTAVISVLTDEPHKASIIAATRGVSLVAPGSLPWELGNAFSAMFKQNRLALQQAHAAVAIFRQIPIQFIDVSVELALQIAADQRIYAYDAYMLASAMQSGAPLLTLDRRLAEAAKRVGLSVLEVTP